MSDKTPRTQNYDVDWGYNLQEQHLVGNPNMFARDMALTRRIAYEACVHSGYLVEYFEAEHEERDLYQDPVVRYKPAVLVSCIFDESPRIRILKNYGWYQPDQEIQGSIIYLPMYYDWTGKKIFSVADNSIIRVSYFGQNFPADFRIMEKRQDSVYGIYWICRLAPEHLDNFEYVTEHGTHYLKKRYNRKPDCDHKKEDPKKSDRDERVFQNDNQEKYSSFKQSEKRKDGVPFEDVKEHMDDEFQSYSQLIMQEFK